MGFKGWKKKAADFVLAVTAPDRVKLETIEENYTQRIQALEENYGQRIQALEENVRHNNAALKELQELRQALHSLEENVRHNNIALKELQELRQALHSLEENVRHNNVALKELQELRQALHSLEENVRHNNIALKELQELRQALHSLEENQRNYNTALDKLKATQNMQVIEAKIEAIKNKLKRVAAAPASSAAQSNGQAAAASASAADTYDDIDYFSFENYFRGSEESIKKRQQIYLPYFQNCKHVVDLGCGRGEFLELLREHHIPATGVDFYDEFVIYAKKKGLSVTADDAVAYLEHCGSEIDGIFAGQLVEHLTVSQIIALCKQAYVRLKKGGYFIMETPNPTSLAIYTHAFYMDPSHQKPVHPLTLKYFTEQAGFCDVQIIFTEESKLDRQIPPLQGNQIGNLDAFNQSMQQVAQYLYGSQDYAVVARR